LHNLLLLHRRQPMLHHAMAFVVNVFDRYNLRKKRRIYYFTNEQKEKLIIKPSSNFSINS
jgi:Cys-tRNA synthase (O-phospho-L-seryl-tRNA:Cys-tRNA synthase)